MGKRNTLALQPKVPFVVLSGVRIRLTIIISYRETLLLKYLGYSDGSQQTSLLRKEVSLM